MVCVGQFKRGKSTLINALVGAAVLPTGVTPVTSVVTIVRHGARLSARLRLQGRGWAACDPTAINLYVSEEHNPANEKRVAAIEVLVPSPLLRHGLCLVDTPGVGSVILANSEATRDFVPHVDAAVLVLGADPPITADELSPIETLAATVRDIIVTVNKADRHSPEERAEVARFTERVLAQSLARDVPVLHVSATAMLTGQPRAYDWETLVDRLTAMTRESGAQLLTAARRRETGRLAARLRGSLDEQHAALLRPLADTEQRAAALRDTVAGAERALIELAHLLDAEEAQLAKRFARREGCASLPSSRPARSLRRRWNNGARTWRLARRLCTATPSGASRSW